MQKNYFRVIFSVYFFTIQVKCRREYFIVSKKELIFFLLEFVTSGSMASKMRQSIFSFDMDMDVDETPKIIKSGKKKNHCWKKNLIWIPSSVENYCVIWRHVAFIGKMRHCGIMLSAPLKMRLTESSSLLFYSIKIERTYGFTLHFSGTH